MQSCITFLKKSQGWEKQVISSAKTHINLRLITLLILLFCILGPLPILANTKGVSKTNSSIVVVSKNDEEIKLKLIDIDLYKKELTENIEYKPNNNWNHLITSTDNNSYYPKFNSAIAKSSNLVSFIRFNHQKDLNKSVSELKVGKEIAPSVRVRFTYENEVFDLLEYKDCVGFIFNDTFVKIDNKGKKAMDFFYMSLPSLYDITGTHLASGGKFINKNSIIITSCYQHPDGSLQDFNSIIIIDLHSKSYKIIKNGYSIISDNYIEIYRNTRIPIAVSPNKKQVASISRFPRKEKKRFKPYEIPVWVSIVNLEDSSVKKILKLNWITNYKTHIDWNQVNPNLIAVNDIKSKNEIYIVNIKSKKVYSIGRTENKKEIVNLKWSTDGNQLAYMDKQGYLFVYNLKKKKLKLLNSDESNFDFYWVD